jgi:hypothetical protein
MRHSIVFALLMLVGCAGGNAPADVIVIETAIQTPTPIPSSCDPLEDELDGFIHSIEVSSDGSMLIAVGGVVVGGYGNVIRTDSDGCVTSKLGDLVWPHSARDRVVNGQRLTLVSETGNSAVLIIDDSGVRVRRLTTLSDGSQFIYPNNADWLSDDTILVTDRDADRVVEVTLDGQILWSYGGESILAGPHSARRLQNGNTLISDSENDRVVEVTRDLQIAWEYRGPLDWPRGVQRLENGDTLIASSYEGQVKQVTHDGRVLWSYSCDLPYETTILKDGRILSSVFSDLISLPSTHIP